MDHKYETKLKNGKPNPKFVDLLEEDKSIAGQKFVCVSFVSPEKLLKQKDMFYFEEFLKQWDFNKSMEKYIQFLNFLSFKYNMQFDDLTNDFKEFVKEEREKLLEDSVVDQYKTFVDNHEEDLDKRFNVVCNFQTHTRGVKIRGSYPSVEEAEMRAKLLREMDPSHDVFVGPVGMWMPWDPEAYKTGRVEYLEDELNQLMQEKKKNETNAKQTFDQRIKETKQKAIEENIKNAEKSGNVLTQTLDNDGNLVGVSTQENYFKEMDSVTSADIRNELFEGDNIVVGKTDNGLSKLLGDKFGTN
jgi:membrane-associated HD superfamily phosphohydrolase